MRFMLTDDQRQLTEAVADYARDQGAAGAVRRAFDAEDGFDEAFWNGAMEMGLGGIAVPEDQGGLGLGLVELALIAEALGYAAAPGPFLGHALATLALTLGDREAAAPWLEGLVSGAAIGAVALGEAGGRWEPEAWSVPFENGTLTGQKIAVLQADRAGLLVVGVAGGGLVLVDPGAGGVTITAREVVDRTRRIFEVTFDAAPAVLLTEDGDAVRKLIDAGLVLLAADAFGGSRRALDLSVEYAHVRKQFGRLIGSFQALKHQLADVAADIEPVRGLYWYAAYAWDHLPDERTRTAAIAKAHATDRFVAAGRAMVQAHGGIGYTWESDVQIWLKRAMFDFSYLGSPSVHRERAARLAGW